MKKFKHMKYLEALKDLKNKCDNGGNFILTHFIKDRHLASGFATVVQSKKIIINKGTKNNPQWIWNSIDPNIKMVEAIKKEAYVKRQKSQTTIDEDDNIINGLKKLKKLCDTNGGNFVYRDFVKKHKISNNDSIAIKSKKIIINKGTRFSPTYVWNTTLSFENILKIIRQNQKTIIIRNENTDSNIKPEKNTRGGKRVGSGRKTLAEEIKRLPKQRSIVILWGLINIKF
jgi:hypothetical protein